MNLAHVGSAALDALGPRRRLDADKGGVIARSHRVLGSRGRRRRVPVSVVPTRRSAGGRCSVGAPPRTPPSA